MKADAPQAALEEINAEIERLKEASATLTRIFSLRAAADIAKTTAAPTAPRGKTARRASAKPAAARKKPEPAKTAEAPEASDTGVRILKFLDKNGPSRVEAIAPGTKLKPNIVAIGLNKLVRDGLAEDNDGFFRATDKGLDAALA